MSTRPAQPHLKGAPAAAVPSTATQRKALVPKIAAPFPGRSQQSSANTTPRVSASATPRRPASRSPSAPTSKSAAPEEKPKKKKASQSPRRDDQPSVPPDELLDALCVTSTERTSAVLYREQACKSLDRHALFSIGWMYYFGLGGCVKSDKKAWQYFSAAAQQSHGLGLYYCGRMKEKGQSVKVDVQSALGYYRRASEQNCDVAMYAAGKLLERLDGMVSEECIALYRRAADLGNRSAFERLERM